MPASRADVEILRLLLRGARRVRARERAARPGARRRVPGDRCGAARLGPSSSETCFDGAAGEGPRRRCGALAAPLGSPTRDACGCCRSSTAAPTCSPGRRRPLPAYPAIGAALADLRRAGARATASRCSIDLAELARLSLPQRRGVRGIRATGSAERDRARRTLRRGRQGVRPRAAGDRILDGPAAAGRAVAPARAAAGRDPRSAGRRRSAAGGDREAAPYRRDRHSALPGHEATRSELGCERRS